MIMEEVKDEEELSGTFESGSLDKDKKMQSRLLNK
jgi:hypothetical protein